MARVDVAPMPLGYRDIPQRLRPCHPPIFPDGEPTHGDRQLALALLLELDDESRRWYLNGRSEFVGLLVPVEYL